MFDYAAHDMINITRFLTSKEIQYCGQYVCMSVIWPCTHTFGMKYERKAARHLCFVFYIVVASLHLICMRLLSFRFCFVSRLRFERYNMPRMIPVDRRNPPYTFTHTHKTQNLLLLSIHRNAIVFLKWFRCANDSGSPWLHKALLDCIHLPPTLGFASIYLKACRDVTLSAFTCRNYIRKAKNRDIGCLY